VPDRIQLRRSRGWRKPAGAIVVARPSRWGNPFTVAEYGAVDRFRWYLTARRGDPAIAQRWPYPSDDQIRTEVAGRDLACWCPPGAPCHADVLLRLANGGAL
jgi:hypothetical protein